MRRPRRPPGGAAARANSCFKRQKKNGEVVGSSLLSPSAVGATWGDGGGHVTMWSRSAGSPVGRPRSVVPAARPSTTKTGPTVARKKAGSRKPAARRPNVLAGGHFSKNYHNDGVEVINIIPLRQMEGFPKSFLDLSHVSVWCRGSRVAVFEKWEEPRRSRVVAPREAKQ